MVPDIRNISIRPFRSLCCVWVVGGGFHLEIATMEGRYQRLANVASYYQPGNSDIMAHIAQRVSTKTSTVKSELHIS